jgi:MFS family permease
MLRAVLTPLTWLVAATFLHFASLYYLAPTLPLYVRHLGGSTYQVGLIVGVFSLASLAVRPFLGIWMDMAGRRGFLVAGAAMYVVASLGYPVIQSVPGLLLWRAFHGIGLAAFSTAAAALAADLAVSGRRGATMGVFGLAQPAALTVGPGIGQAIQSAYGYTGLFAAAAGTAVAALVCALVIPRDSSARGQDTAGWGRGRGKTFLDAAAGPATVQFAASVPYGTIVSFIAVVAQDRGLQTVAIFFALFAASSLGMRLVAGKTYDAWGPAAVLTPTLVALAAGMAILTIAAGPVAFLLAAVLAGVGIGGTHTTLMARVADHSPHESRASSVAAFIVCWELGVGGGTILMGHLAEVAGFGVMFGAGTAFPLAALASLPWLSNKRATRSHRDA